MIPENVVYRDDQLGGAQVMRFRLVYFGPLRPSNGDPERGQLDPLAKHKHEIRRVFHEQLRELWAGTEILRLKKMYPRDFGGFGKDARPNAWGNERFDQAQQYPLPELLAYRFREHGYEWVPLALVAYKVHCELEIIMLRRDGGGSPLDNGDLDNRIKTLIDALKKPKDGAELYDEDQTPRDDEKPFYVLLEDDKIVSRLSVETDRLLYPKQRFPKSPERMQQRVEDERMVSALITVNIKGYYPSVFNSMWN